MSAGLTLYASRYESLKAELAKAESRIEAVFPSGCGLTARRHIGIVLDATMRDVKLLDCYVPSIVRAVMQAAECGLELGSPFGEAYLVPYNNNKQGRIDAQFIPGYKGLIKLALGSPRVEVIEARIVRVGDEFDYEYGTAPRIVHKPSKDTSNGRAVTHAYCVSFLASGRSSFTVMDRAELDKIKAGSRAKNGPWKAHETEMFRKCPTRKHMKTLDLSAAARAALGYDNEREPLRPSSDGFSTGRADDLKATLGVQAPAGNVVDADFDEDGGDSDVE